MTSQLVRATEAFRTARELAGMWLFAGVCPYVPGLVFQAMEGLIAHGTLVWSW